jgi:hypothetical protein
VDGVNHPRQCPLSSSVLILLQPIERIISAAKRNCYSILREVALIGSGKDCANDDEAIGQ